MIGKCQLRSAQRSLLVLLLTACGGVASGEPSQADPQSQASIQKQGLSCGITKASRIEQDGIGDLRIGRSSEEIAKLCNVVQDTIELDAEALPQRVLRVDLNRDTVSALLAENKVWRIEIDTSAFHTAEGIGVGTPLMQLLMYDQPRGLEGDGFLYVTLGRYCGLSFRLNYVPTEAEHRGEWTKESLEQLPSDTRVDRVLIVGC
jgi:hypothetical protein